MKIEKYVYREITRFPIIKGFTDDEPEDREPMAPGDFLRLQGENYGDLAFFLCPCGCGECCNVPLGKDGWQFTQGANGPTLSPSLQVFTPCRSHFYVSDGRIVWC